VLINLDIFYLLFIFLYIRFVVFVYRLVNKVDQCAFWSLDGQTDNFNT